MNFNIITFELKKRIKFISIWMISFVLIIAASFIEFNSIGTTGDNMKKIVDSMPRLMKAVYGMSDFDVSQISGYTSLIMVYVFIMAAIMSAFLGFSLLNNEYRQKMAEFIFAKPMTKKSILTSKMMAAAIILLMENLSILITIFVTLKPYSNQNETFSIIIPLIMIEFLLLSFGVLVSVLTAGDKKGSIIISIVTSLIYMLVVARDLFESNVLTYINPISYYTRTMFTENVFAYSAVIMILIIIFIQLSLKKSEQIEII